MRHLLILGETGAGKSSLTKAVAPYYPRVLVLDRHWEYDDGYEPVYGFDALAARITNDVRGSWRIAFRTDRDAEWGAATVLVYQLHHALARAGERADSLVVMEEVGLFSSPHKLPRWVGNLWNYGRHYGITAIGICRQDTETHPVLRLNSTLVFFRCTEVTAKVAKPLGSAKVQRIAELPLYQYQPGEPPRADVHYVSYPEVGDIFNRISGARRLRIIA